MHHASIIVGTRKGINKTIVVLEKIVFETCKNVIKKKKSAVEPRYDEESRECQSVFAITRFRYIEILFHAFYYSVGG